MVELIDPSVFKNLPGGAVPIGLPNGLPNGLPGGIPSGLPTP